MRIVTAITPSERNAKRATIRVDNRAVATLPIKVIESLSILPGVAWSDELAQRVAEAAAFDKAFTAGMKAVDRRALSRSQVTQKLLGKGFDEALVRRVVLRMEEIGAIDDAALGRSLVEELQSKRPAGEALLRQKLAQRGIDETQADHIIDGAAPRGEDAVAAAVELAKKKLATMRNLDATTRQRRVYSLLARRGFDEDTAHRAMELLSVDFED